MKMQQITAAFAAAVTRLFWASVTAGDDGGPIKEAHDGSRLTGRFIPLTGLCFLTGFALVTAPTSAIAGVICSGCEKIDAPAGTYIGTYNPTTWDVGTFTHTDLSQLGSGTSFIDYWIFDLNPGGYISVSADFTQLTGITNFQGRLLGDDGSTTCASAPVSPTNCSSVGVSSPIGSDQGVRWEIIASGLGAGRYIIEVTGTTSTTGQSSYSGQLGFSDVPPVPSISDLGGTATGVTIQKVECKNKSTRQKVTIDVNGSANNWNCESAGLVVSPNDKVDMKVKGTAN